MQKNCANTVKVPFASARAQPFPSEKEEFSACLEYAFGVEKEYTEVKPFNSKATNFCAANAPLTRVLRQDLLDAPIYDLFISPTKTNKGHYDKGKRNIIF